MFYAIRHLTRYRYNRPIWQSMMEVRMHPRSEQSQRRERDEQRWRRLVEQFLRQLLW